MTRLLALSLVFLAGCTSIEERQAHMQGQITMVRSQTDAKTDQKAAEAMAKAELYKALAEVAKANPEQASAVTVALAVQGLGAEGEGDDSSVVPLQPLKNEGLEFARVFAAPLMNTATAVATAYINADVAKTQSDNAAQYRSMMQLQTPELLKRLRVWVLLRLNQVALWLTVITTRLAILQASLKIKFLLWRRQQQLQRQQRKLHRLAR